MTTIVPSGSFVDDQRRGQSDARCRVPFARLANDVLRRQLRNCSRIGLSQHLVGQNQLAIGGYQVAQAIRRSTESSIDRRTASAIVWDSNLRLAGQNRVPLPPAMITA